LPFGLYSGTTPSSSSWRRWPWPSSPSEERRVPVLVEIMCERETNAAMGLSIDKINEYEPVLDGSRETAGQVVGGIPERD